MTANQITITNGPDRLDYYGSLEHGKEILFYFGDKDVAAFVVTGSDNEGEDRHSWNTRVTLLDCSQSATLKNSGFEKGDHFHGFYSVLHCRKGFLSPDKAWIQFSNEVNTSVFRTIADCRNSLSYAVNISFGNGRAVTVSSDWALVDEVNKSVMFKGVLAARRPTDLFGKKLTVGQKIRGFYDLRNKAGFIWVDD